MSEKRPIAPLLLHGRQLDVDDGLLLRRYALLDVRLHPPQHERAHRLVQLLGVLPSGAATEAALPVVERRERVVVEEVEERVQLGEVVLQRREEVVVRRREEEEMVLVVVVNARHLQRRPRK